MNSAQSLLPALFTLHNFLFFSLRCPSSTCSLAHFSKTNKGEQGRKMVGGSKLGNLERTYFFTCPPMGGVKNKWGAIFVTILLHFRYFISLETANTQKSEVFLLIIF